MLIARYLGSREFGVFALVWAYLELFRVAADFGMEPVLIRRVVLDRSAWPGLAKSALALKLCLASTASLLAFLLSGVWGYGESFPTLLLLALPSLFLTSTTSVLTVPYVAGLQLHRLAWIGAVSGSLYLAGIMWAGALGLGTPVFIGCTVAYDLITLIGVLVVSRGHAEIGGGTRVAVMIELLWEAKWPAVASCLVTAYVRVGLLLVGAWGDMRAAGNLALATRLAEGFKVVSGAVATSTFPLFTRLVKAERREDIVRFFCILGVMLAGGMLVVALLVQYRLGFLIITVFPGYEDLVAFLVPLLWAMVFVFVNMHASALLSGFGLFWLTTCAAAINFSISLLTNAVLIPRYGGIGAAWAYLVTEAVNSSFQLPAVAAVLATRPARRLGAGEARVPE